MAISSIRSPDTPVSKPALPEGTSMKPAQGNQDQAVPAAAPTKEQVTQAVENLKKAVEPATANNLLFSVDDATGKTIVRVVDQETGKTIRQIPSEELVAIAKNIERMQGLLVEQKA
jgi:flagellar protein FlaG